MSGDQPSDADATVHASCVLVGEGAALVRGASGSGKSRLARALVEAAAARGLFARLVGDDRIRLARRNGRLLARPHPAIAGLIEARGVGLLPLPHADAALVRLVIDLVADAPPRLPEEPDRHASLLRVRLPRLVAADPSAIVPIALDRLAGFTVTGPQ